ncbi:hypothetical protein [Pediococcus acidilactici]|uniref:hypothetical protein n=1 Tax=Pediococcus acidilactici TaxID=1254 RepID=UPI002B002096|nr:hypothetical protein [Pediococcus acidilactici]WQS10795.1 hypothetical protein SGW13_08705 [Pediococcus acidilactici]
MALTELVNGTKLPKQIISTALGVVAFMMRFGQVTVIFMKRLRTLTMTMRTLMPIFR